MIKMNVVLLLSGMRDASLPLALSGSKHAPSREGRSAPDSVEIRLLDCGEETN